MKKPKSGSFGACAYRSWRILFSPRSPIWEKISKSEKAKWGLFAKAIGEVHEASVMHSIMQH